MEKLKINLFTESEPQVFVSQNDTERKTIYNHNIRQHTKDEIEGYLYDSLIVCWPLSSNSIVKQMLEERYGIDYEQKLQNEYFSVVEGVDTTASKQPYIDYLTARKDLKLQIEADCVANNVPV